MDDAPKCNVFNSPIHHKGLFATFYIDSGEVVCNYDVEGIWMTKKFTELTIDEVNRCWWIGLDTERCLVPTKDIKFFYANHSNTPNCHWDRINKKLIALKNIAIGEEITYNYNLEVKPHNWIKFDWLK